MYISHVTSLWACAVIIKWRLKWRESKPQVLILVIVTGNIYLWKREFVSFIYKCLKVVASFVSQCIVIYLPKLNWNCMVICVPDLDLDLDLRDVNNCMPFTPSLVLDFSLKNVVAVYICMSVTSISSEPNVCCTICYTIQNIRAFVSQIAWLFWQFSVSFCLLRSFCVNTVYTHNSYFFTSNCR